MIIFFRTSNLLDAPVPRQTWCCPKETLGQSVLSEQGSSSGSDGDYRTWLSKNNLAPFLGASAYKLFDTGYFHGTFVNPTLYSALGARWSVNGAPSSNLFVHAGLSAVIRSQAYSNFSRTQQADLNLPVLSLSSLFECDCILYFPMSDDTRKSFPYCVVYSDGDVAWISASEARLGYRRAQQQARLLSISSQDSLVGMLGLRAACGYQEVVKAYNETLKLIHPDKCGLPGTDAAFMKLHPAFTEWNTARARHGWNPPATLSSAPVNSESHSECRGDLGARSPLASQPRRPGVPQQRTSAESAPSGSNSANVPQNDGTNSAPAHDNVFRHSMSKKMSHLLSQPR